MTRGTSDVARLTRHVALLLLLALGMGCAPRPEQTVTLALAGDVMLGRDVRRMCKRTGVDYPFVNVAPMLRQADLAFCNLESPLSNLPYRFPRVNALVGGLDMVPALAHAGFDVVNLANNHAVDAERAGLAQMVGLMDEYDISPCGIGYDMARAERGAVREVRGVRVGFIGYSNFPYLNFVPDRNDWSILMLREDVMRRTIPRLARRSDITVVSFHWGKEGEREPSDWERRMAHLAIDLGATIVAGHHAHVRGPIERYRDGLIAYCLGNLIFDDKSYGGNEGMILTCTVSRRGVDEYETVPTVVGDCQARVDGSGGNGERTNGSSPLPLSRAR